MTSYKWLEHIEESSQEAGLEMTKFYVGRMSIIVQFGNYDLIMSFSKMGLTIFTNVTVRHYNGKVFFQESCMSSRNTIEKKLKHAYVIISKGHIE